MQYRRQRDHRNTAVISAHAGIQQGWATGSPSTIFVSWEVVFC